MQIEVIDRANACDQLAGKARADTVHQSPAHRAEMVLHFISSGDSVALSKLGELIFAADMLGGRLVDDEVRCEHGCCDFAAVRTVADEAVDEVRSFYRLFDVSLGSGTLQVLLTISSWTAPQKHVAVALPFFSPVAPSEGSGMLLILACWGSEDARWFVT